MLKRIRVVCFACIILLYTFNIFNYNFLLYLCLRNSSATYLVVTSYTYFYYIWTYFCIYVHICALVNKTPDQTLTIQKYIRVTNYIIDNLRHSTYLDHSLNLSPRDTLINVQVIQIQSTTYLAYLWRIVLIDDFNYHLRTLFFFLCALNSIIIIYYY